MYKSRNQLLRFFSYPFLASIIASSLINAASYAQTDFIRTIPGTVAENNEIQVQVKFTTYTFSKAGNPPVTLKFVGMIHIAEKKFYEAAANILQKSQVEFYEGVAPIGFYGPPFVNDSDFNFPETRLRLTKLRLFALQRRVDKFKNSQGRLPSSFEELLSPQMEASRYSLSLNELKDGWGNDFILKNTNDTLEITSLGADGKLGGSELNRDLGFSDALPPAIDTDQFLEIRNIQLTISAQKANLFSQPKDLNYLAPTTIRADVSSDLLFGDIGTTNGLQGFKYWFWREQLPTILVYNNLYLGGEFAILYGAGHGEKIEKSLLDIGFQKINEEWVTAFTISNSMPEEVRKTRQAILDDLLNN